MQWLSVTRAVCYRCNQAGVWWPGSWFAMIVGVIGATQCVGIHRLHYLLSVPTSILLILAIHILLVQQQRSHSRSQISLFIDKKKRVEGFDRSDDGWECVAKTKTEVHIWQYSDFIPVLIGTLIMLIRDKEVFTCLRS